MTKFFSSKCWLIAFFFVIAMSVSVFFINKKNNSQDESNILQDSSIKKDESIHLSGVVTEVPKKTETNQKQTPKISDAQFADFQFFQTVRGHVQFNQNYLSYSQDVLEKLANQNDWSAYYALAMKADAEGDHNKAVKIYEDAIIRGSSGAITELGRSMILNTHLDSLSEADRNKSTNEILALYKVAELRGDIFVASSRVGTFISDNHIQLTQELIDQVNTRAQQMYSSFEAKRAQLGLEPFDNGVPESVQDYYSKLKIKMPY